MRRRGMRRERVSGSSGRPPRTEQRPGKQTIATKVLTPRREGAYRTPRVLELVTQVEMKRLSVIRTPATKRPVAFFTSVQVV